MKITISVIKADIGGYVGHTSVHPRIMEVAEDHLQKAKEQGILIDYFVTRVGDDLQLIMTHKKGTNCGEIHKLAWDTFVEGTEIAKSLKQYGAGQDLLSDAFSGNIKGLGPGLAEMEFEERPSEPIIIFMADKTSPGAWNIPLFRIFADPFNTPGLVIDPKLHNGFIFEVLDVYEHKKILMSTPEELYDLLILIGAAEHYIIKAVYRKEDKEIAAISSTQRLSMMAGRYVGKDDPVMIVRAQSGFPAVGEILEPFAFPHLVAGWMRGSHYGPLMPVALHQANPSRFDGPPRVCALGFQLAEGKLIGPRDLFDDPAFDEARATANKIANYLRAHGPFEPHRLGLKEMEYTTLPDVLKKVKNRFIDLE
jgi:fructose 1,6-bisphosphate aldolase/phosphatase